MIEKKILFRRLSFVVYFIVAFLVFLFLLFPFDRIRTILESEVRRRTQLELTVARISPRFLNRFVLTDVVLTDRRGAVLFESPSVSTTLSLFVLLRGGVAATLTSKAYGGQVLIKLEQAPGRQYLLVDTDGLDIGSYAMLKNAGLTLSGKIGGNFEMTGESGKGRIWVKNVASRRLTVKGFPVPDLDFESGWLDIDVKGDRLLVKKLELEGKDLKVHAAGDVVMREQGPINLTIRLKPSERMVHEQQSLFSLLKVDSDGFYRITIGGLVSAPVPQF
jgi:type II secretion system protein N